jgi:hypothetical protein
MFVCIAAFLLKKKIFLSTNRQIAAPAASCPFSTTGA